jgi:hypothetical protein
MLYMYIRHLYISYRSNLPRHEHFTKLRSPDYSNSFLFYSVFSFNSNSLLFLSVLSFNK